MKVLAAAELMEKWLPFVLLLLLQQQKERERTHRIHKYNPRLLLVPRLSNLLTLWAAPSSKVLFFSNEFRAHRFAAVKSKVCIILSLHSRPLALFGFNLTD